MSTVLILGGNVGLYRLFRRIDWLPATGITGGPQQLDRQPEANRCRATSWIRDILRRTSTEETDNQLQYAID